MILTQRFPVFAALLLAPLVIALVISLGSSTAFAVQPVAGMENETPKQLDNVGFDEHLGNKIDLDLPFTDQDGKAVTLRDYVKNGKPLLLSLAYYTCPSLCNFHLNGLLDAFKQMPKPLGSEFNAVAVSIEPKDTPEIARKKLNTYLKSYDRPEGNNGWNFLVGKTENINTLAKEVGFKYHWDEEQKQWAHASAAYVITPDGRISRYLYGIVFDPKTIRLSMIEASNGQIGTIVDRLVLFCFHFDPKTSKYSIYVMNVMRGAAVLILLLLGGFIGSNWFKGSRNSRRHISGDAT
jgi:protein SCO1/2